MPDYEIIEINQDSTEYFNFKKELAENKWFRTIYERKMWAYIADYVRIKTLYDNGGVYFDTDVSAVKTLDAFLENPAFVGIQDASVDGLYDLVEPAILGSEPGNPFLRQVLDFYSNHGIDTIWTTLIYTMPEVFKHVLEKNYGAQKYPAKSQQEIINYGDLVLYPEKYFIPFRYGHEFTPDCVVAETCTIHWFGGSWVDMRTMNFLWSKHDPKALRRIAKLERKSKKLFGFIPLYGFSVRKTPERATVLLFNFIPLWIVRTKPYATIHRLFGIIPIYKVSG